MELHQLMIFLISNSILHGSNFLHLWFTAIKIFLLISAMNNFLLISAMNHLLAPVFIFSCLSRNLRLDYLFSMPLYSWELSTVLTFLFFIVFNNTKMLFSECAAWNRLLSCVSGFGLVDFWDFKVSKLKQLSYWIAVQWALLFCKFLLLLYFKKAT